MEKSLRTNRLIWGFFILIIQTDTGSARSRCVTNLDGHVMHLTSFVVLIALKEIKSHFQKSTSISSMIVSVTWFLLELFKRYCCRGRQGNDASTFFSFSIIQLRILQPLITTAGEEACPSAPRSSSLNDIAPSSWIKQEVGEQSGSFHEKGSVQAGVDKRNDCDCSQMDKIYIYIYIKMSKWVTKYTQTDVNVPEQASKLTPTPDIYYVADGADIVAGRHK